MNEARSRPHWRAASVAAAGLAALSVALGACGPGGMPAASPAAGTISEPSLEGSAMDTPTHSPNPTALTLASPAFGDAGPIPREYTCRGQDVSPAVAWHGVPPGTAALVLFVDDPDGRDWVHWIVLDLPGIDGELPRAVSPSAAPPQQGRNDFGRIGYGGPCPPSGNHHYRFTLYALAAPLGLPGHPDGAAVRAALGRASVLRKVTLVGTYRA
jgi:Raf kinase inhibitor-like YbhB/YbcL family protein